MGNIILQPNSTAQWYTLVNEAELHCHMELGEDLESYLVFLLIRYSNQPDLANSILALEFLTSINAVGRLQQDKLKIVGDKCLLYSGFFPDQIKRKRVKKSYFIDLGQTAYYALANLSEKTVSELYQSLCDRFVPMHTVLRTMRKECRD